MGSSFPLGERLWHKNGVMAPFKARRSPSPLTEATLHQLALRYVGKYATTRAKLRSYLSRKLRERGWNGDREPALDVLANRFAELGYIDDAAYALGQSRSLSVRGYGRRRVEEKLRIAGVDEADGAAAREHAQRQQVAAAVRFAERRRLGPFAAAVADWPQREKWIAALVRAGHDFSLARAISLMDPGQVIDQDELCERARLSDD